MSRLFNGSDFTKPMIVRTRVEEPTEPQVDRVERYDELGPVLKPFVYTETQLHVRKELFEDAQLCLNWGGTLSADDLSLLKAAARVLLIRGITHGDFGISGSPMKRPLYSEGSPARN